MIISYLDAYKELFTKQGFILIPSSISSEVTMKCKKWSLGDAANQSVQGNNRDHAWVEIIGPTPFDLYSLFDRNSLEIIVSRKIKNWTQWVNIYSRGQFIEPHCDAGGDAHILVCVEAPCLEDGGQLWLYETDNIIPMTAGDLIIFKASSIHHGTTPVLETSKKLRITLNIRIWLE